MNSLKNEKSKKEGCMGVVYVLFASSCRGIAQESYDKSPVKVDSRFNFAKARGTPVRVYGIEIVE